MNSTIDLAPLRELIEQAHGANDMAYKGLFANGCNYLLQGGSLAGMKAVQLVLDSLRDFADQDYLNSILHSAAQNAADYAREIGANMEFEDPFREAGRGARTPNEFEAVVRDAIHQCLWGCDVELVTQEAGRQLRAICEFEALALSTYR